MTSRSMLAAAGLMGLVLASPSFAAVEAEQGGTVSPDMSQDSSALPQDYSIPAVPPGGMKTADNHPMLKKSVHNTKGEELGTIETIVLDTKAQEPIYAELALKDSQQRVPVPFNYFHEGQSGLVLNATKDQLQKAGANFGGRGKSQDFEHHGSEPLKPNLRQGGG